MEKTRDILMEFATSLDTTRRTDFNYFLQNSDITPESHDSLKMNLLNVFVSDILIKSAANKNIVVVNILPYCAIDQSFDDWFKDFKDHVEPFILNNDLRYYIENNN